MAGSAGARSGRTRLVVVGIAILVLLGGCFAFLLSATSYEEPSLVYPPDTPIDEQVSTIMQQHIVHSGALPVHGFVLYAENGSRNVVVEEGAGTSWRGGEAIDGSYQFKIASVTKTSVAAIIFQLLEEGELALDDPASRFVGQIPYLRYDELHLLDGEPYAQDITIDQLLQHRTGFQDIFTDAGTRFNVSVLLRPNRQYSPELIADTYFRYQLNEVPLFKPGAGYHYSDMNYVLLGLLIEQITGDSLDHQIRARILEPLGLTNTYFEYVEPDTDSAPRLYSYFGPLNMRGINTSYDWSGGGLVSTTRDMATFIKALFGMELFDQPSTLALMLDNRANLADGETYARGINHYEIDGTTYYGHGGFYGTLLLYNPETEVVFSAHLAQAIAPYAVMPSVQTLLDIID